MDTPTLSAQIVDITTLNVDAIVNAVNEELASGGRRVRRDHRAPGTTGQRLPRHWPSPSGDTGSLLDSSCLHAL